MPPVSSSADRTAGRAGAPRPRRPGWRHLLELWSPALEALVSHTHWRPHGLEPDMKTEEAELEPVGSHEGNFNRLARDFDRALHLARFSSTQLFLIQQAREQSWTRAQIARSPEKYPFRLNLSEVARLLGADRSGVNRQHAKLVAARVFADLGDGCHFINKDYQTWADEKGRPLFSAEQIQWCFEMRKRKKGGDSSPQAGLNDLRTPVLTPEDSSPHPLRTPVLTPADSNPQVGLNDLRTPVLTPDPAPRTPLYEARTPTGTHAPAQRVSEEKRRDPEEQQRRPPGRKADEAEVGKLIEEARGCVHFLIDPDDCTYRAVRDAVRAWLAKPGVDPALIREAYERVKARKPGPKPQGFVKYIDPIIVELRDDRERHERLWSADAAGSPQGPHASPAALKRQAARDRRQADLEREKARRKELFGGED